MKADQLRRGPDILAVGLVILVIATACGLTFAIANARRVARESSCTGHIYKITQAVLDYRQEHGHFPGAVANESTHSWRVLILPQLGYDDLYQQYDFNEPWDSPDNEKVMGQMPSIFTCPNCPSDNCTSYFLLRGSDSSVLVVECNHQSICWTEPRDIDPRRASTTPCDPSGNGFGLSDGRVVRGNALPRGPVNGIDVGGLPK